MNSLLEHSAGAVITRIDIGKKEILLVTYENQKIGYPKGHLESGETPEQAAMREAREETGYAEVIIGQKIGTYQRLSIKPDGSKVLKEISMFYAEVRGQPNFSIAEETTKWVQINELSEEMFNYAEDAQFFMNKVLPSLNALNNI